MSAPNIPAPDAAPVPDDKAGLVSIHKDPADALESVRAYYRNWTGQLTQRSFELSMSVIAANWAVFGGINQLLGNSCAKWSVAIVVLGLILTLVATWRMGDLLLERINYAECNPQSWVDEFKATKNTSSPWPYSAKIDCWGKAMRWVKVGGPVIGGLLFFVALLRR